MNSFEPQVSISQKQARHSGASRLRRSSREYKETIGGLLDARIVRPPGGYRAASLSRQGLRLRRRRTALRRRRYVPYIRRRAGERQECRHGTRPRTGSLNAQRPGLIAAASCSFAGRRSRRTTSPVRSLSPPRSSSGDGLRDRLLGRCQSWSAHGAVGFGYRRQTRRMVQHAGRRECRVLLPVLRRVGVQHVAGIERRSVVLTGMS